MAISQLLQLEMRFAAVFEGILYFVLGFLAAALIALMISPAIWNRAVTLTKRRIESSVPLTLNEVQADKDQLRAEFAMSTRRLELSIEELKDKAARQVIEINRKRDELAKLAEESREKMHAVNELEGYGSEIQQKLAARERELDKTTTALRETREKLEASALELERVNRRLDKESANADSRRIELVAKQTSLDDMTDQFEGLREENAHLMNENQRLHAAMKTGTEKLEDADDRGAKWQKKIADLEEKLRRREREIKEIRAGGQADSETSNELTRLLMDEKNRTNDLEAKLASATLRTEALLSDASNENVSKAMEQLNAERKELEKKLQAVTTERDSFQAQATANSQAASADWETERKENAILRERINDLAAQVTAMTAAIEGPESPIHDIIASAEKASKTSTDKKTGRAGPSLAERVRVIQEAARLKQG